MTLKEIEEAIIQRVWGHKGPKNATDQAFRENVARFAMEVCHETGEENSFINFCADTLTDIIQFNAFEIMRAELTHLGHVDRCLAGFINEDKDPSIVE